MVFPTRPRYILTTKVMVLIKLNNMPLKALVIMPSTAAITLGSGGDTSIRDIDL